MVSATGGSCEASELSYNRREERHRFPIVTMVCPSTESPTWQPITIRLVTEMADQWDSAAAEPRTHLEADLFVDEYEDGCNRMPLQLYMALLYVTSMRLLIPRSLQSLAGAPRTRV